MSGCTRRPGVGLSDHWITTSASLVAKSSDGAQFETRKRMCPSSPRAEVPVRLDLAPQGRQVEVTHGLVAALDDWLDDNSAWPRRDAPPRILLVSRSEASARRGPTGSFQRGRLRGLYDPEQEEILLVRPWDPHDIADASVLLHELVHNRQAPHHWYCPAA